MSNETNVALVTGANRGIGFEVARQLARRGMTVILGARDLGKGQAAARKLVDEGLEVLPRRLDVTDEASIKNLATEVEREFGRLDVLVNNAGILYDTWQRATNADMNTVHEAIIVERAGERRWRTSRRRRQSAEPPDLEAASSDDRCHDERYRKPVAW